MGKLYARRSTKNLIQRSSVVERSAVNRLVVGSNPTAGAKNSDVMLVSLICVRRAGDFVEA